MRKLSVRMVVLSGVNSFVSYMRKKKFIALVAGLFVFLGAFAQNYPVPQGGNMPNDGIIRGKIIDGKDNTPIEYASVALYNVRDSSLVTGTITGQDGSFVLNNLPYGRYYVEVTFVGFKKMRHNGIIVSPRQKEVNIGELHIEELIQALKEVEVIGNQNRLEYKIDKKVVQVSQDIVSSGGTAVEVLENTPSVTVDVDGNVQLRGSSNFTVLIDGKPSVLKGTEALQQIPASTIQSIEIITNPSAKYDPEGVAGIINVVMKKSKITGVSGILNTTAGITHKQYSTDLLLNYKVGKFNFFAGGDWMDFSNPGSGKMRRENYLGPDTTFFLINNNKGDMNRKGYSVRGGFDYNATDNTTVSLSGEYGSRSFGRMTTGKYHQYTEPLFLNKYYIQSSGFDRSNDFSSLNLNFQHKFDKPGHTLDGLVFYSYEKDDESNPLTETFTDALWNAVDSIIPIRSRALEGGTENDWRVKLDYVYPITDKSKLEAGYQGRFEDEVHSYSYDNYDPDTKTWITDPNQINKHDFVNNIQSLYAIYSNELKWVSFQVGLRAEYTDRLIKSLVIEEKYPYEKLDFFPSFHLSKSFKNNQQVLFSYSRRLNRPRSFFLDPFPTYMDPLNMQKGNPALEPEYINSYELSYQRNIKMIQLSVEGYYRQTNNMITNISKPLETNPLVMVRTFDNFNKSASTGVELMANAALSKSIQVSLTGTVYHYTLDGQILGEDAVSSTTTWNTRLNSNIRLKWGTRIQLMAFYNAPSINPQGENGDFFMTSMGIRQDFLKRKLSATLQVRDIFNTMHFSFTSSQPGVFYSSGEFRRSGPVISLTLSLKLNNFKETRKQIDEENNDSGREDMMM